MIYNKSTIMFIKNISFLNKLPEKSLEDILSTSIIKNFKKDERIYIEDDYADKLYIILNGSLKLYNSSMNGNESVTRLLSLGDFFGEVSLSDSPYYRSNAEATRNSQVLEIPVEPIKRQIQQDHKTGMILLQELIKYQSKLESQIEYLSVMNAPQRIALYIMNSMDKKQSDLNTFSLQHEKSLIATFLGMKPETFSRAIKKLEDVDVRINGKEVSIKDLNRLYKFCTERSNLNRSAVMKLIA